jgi:hypothetical protein
MIFRFALASLLLSLTTAHAQNPERLRFRTQPGPFPHELPELTPEQKADCLKQARIKRRVEKFRECDDGGCYFNEDPDFVLTQETEMGCRFQKALQRRLEEAHKKMLEAESKSRKSN